jgi:uncharacterized ion transporter superfamily protein YfcC
MDEKSGIQISRRAFLQSVFILLALMLVAGVATLLIPSGEFARAEVDGREVVLADTFTYTERPDYPVWRWLTAPLEVLAGPEAATIIVIILFLMMVGVAFAVLEHSGILNSGLAKIVSAFGGQKYVLLLAISFFFMALGAFFGIFEEIVPLVPLMIALAYSLGWDAMVGLGMSALATNLGFSAAISNPFTIGVAQRLAGLPLFSGAPLRVVVFLVIYALFAFFLVQYAKKVERDPKKSLVFGEDGQTRAKYGKFETKNDKNLRGASIWLVVFGVLIGIIVVLSPFVAILGDIVMPLVGLLFLIAGIGTGLLSARDAQDKKAVWRAAGQGAAGIAPAIPLILMAASVKHIIASGGVLDTVLYSASDAFRSAGGFSAAMLMYGLALVIEFFVSSGSAKAFLVMPILLPLADLVNLTRQVAVTAYCFGDGFSNMAYPTNPVLLIVLGLGGVSYGKWLRWTLPLWGGVLVVTSLFLAIAVAINYGPF